MAEIKNFGLVGVGPDLQLGKAGPRLVNDEGVVEARGADGLTLTTVRAANAVANTDVVTLAQLNASMANAGVADGFQLILGDVVTEGDGSWANGAVPLTDDTKVSSAIDSLNEVLGKLVPTAPPNFPNANSLAVASTGTSPLLASGAQDNASTGLTAGTSVTRITTATVASSNTFQDMGPGESGTITLYVNNVAVGTKTLTGTGDNSTNAGLVIADQKDYPVATPGFWKSVDVSVSGASVQTGVNNMRIQHSGAASTNLVTFVRDNLNTAPTISSTSVALNANGTLAYSSGVPHFGTGGSLTVGASISNLAGQTYYNGNPLSIGGTNSVLATQTFSYATTGISTPIAANTTTATAVTPVTVNVNPTNTHNQGQLSITGQNVAGTSTAVNPSTIILVKAGTTTRVDEMNVTVSGLGSSPNNNNATRVGMATGNTPSNATSTWLSNASINTWDATVVGGALKNDVTNYSTGYLPAGPNLSGQDAAQYVTFAFQRTALSQFKINVTGTYAGVWISLPGVSDNSGVSPNALGGAWWNAFVAYAGAGVPGGVGDTPAGCASGTVMNGASGTFQITFGTASSTSATGNTILVRIRLNAGQSITALSFTN